MNKKVSVSGLFIWLLLILLSPGLAQASSGLTVLNSSAEADFPSSISFKLSAESDVNITDIRLHYMVERMAHTQVTTEIYIEFLPAATVEAKWDWDMRKSGGMPPGSSVEYWWTVEDAGGDKVKTEPMRVQFEDNRYPWYSLNQGKVTLYWYEGDDAFGQELMAVTQQALIRLAEDTGAELEKPVKIYIYADTRDLQGSMIFPQEWTGGVAFTEFGIIAIGIAPDSLDWGRGAVAHELTHLVMHQMTFNPYGSLPTWLNEGLSMYAEGELVPGYVALLNDAAAKGSLISVRSLASPFSAYAEESLLAYTQSYSLVDFLINEYGQGKMFEMLNTFRQGSGYDETLVKVYGFDMDGLDSLWRDYIMATVPPVQTVEEKGLQPALVGMLVGIASGLLLWLAMFIESWAWKRGW
ncbi:peptidase MA family metallohydrolase [Chloroflexota bacterium]